MPPSTPTGVRAGGEGRHCLQTPLAYAVSLVAFVVLTPVRQWQVLPAFTLAVTCALGFLVHEIVPAVLLAARRQTKALQDQAASKLATPGSISASLRIEGNRSEADAYENYQLQRRWQAFDLFMMVMAWTAAITRYGKTEECSYTLVTVFIVPICFAASVKLWKNRPTHIDYSINMVMMAGFWGLNLSSSWYHWPDTCMVEKGIWDTPQKFFMLTLFQAVFDMTCLSFSMRWVPLGCVLIGLALVVRGCIIITAHWSPSLIQHWGLRDGCEPWMLFGGLLVLPVLGAMVCAFWIRFMTETAKLKKFLETRSAANPPQAASRPSGAVAGTIVND